MRIAIVNDTPLVAEVMRRAVSSAGRYQIAWMAMDGDEAVRRCKEDRPDIILMDLIMPKMDGVEATRQIMANSPCAILVVTEVMESKCGKVFDAMSAGALDVVRAPAAIAKDKADGVAGFLFKIDSVARTLGLMPAPPPISVSTNVAECLVAIGSSAGGPAALTMLLRELPADFPAAIVIVQHVDAHFAPGLAKWLSESCRLPVRAAVIGDSPTEGSVLVASSNDHLVFESPTRLGYSSHPADYSYRPSINAFFESAARRWRKPIIGVLLTGMGSDGASGLKLLRDLGHHTIAQDRASSAVYGMPKAAAEMRAATEILPLEKIASTLCTRVFAKKPAATPLAS